MRLRARIRPAEIEKCLFDDAVEGNRRAIASVEPHQRAQPANHFGGAIDLRHSLLGDFHDLVCASAARADGIGHQACIRASRHEGLVNLMRNRSGQFTQATEPREARQRFTSR